MTDEILITFSTTVQTARTIQQDAEALYDDLSRLLRSMSVLFATGLQGAFLSQLHWRFDQVMGQFQQVCDESSEAGRDLAAIVTMVRAIDSQCAMQFNLYSSGMIAEIGSIPVTAGGADVAAPNRLNTIKESINRLQQIVVSLQQHIAEIDRQLQHKLDSWIISLFGYNYEDMRTNLQDSLERTESRIHELEIERAQIESTQSDLPNPQEATQSLSNTAASETGATASSQLFVGNIMNLQSTSRKQYTYQYDGKGNR